MATDQKYRPDITVGIVYNPNAQVQVGTHGKCLRASGLYTSTDQRRCISEEDQITRPLCGWVRSLPSAPSNRGTPPVNTDKPRNDGLKSKLVRTFTKSSKATMQLFSCSNATVLVTYGHRSGRKTRNVRSNRHGTKESHEVARISPGGGKTKGTEKEKGGARKEKKGKTKESEFKRQKICSVRLTPHLG